MVAAAAAAVLPFSLFFFFLLFFLFILGGPVCVREGVLYVLAFFFFEGVPSETDRGGGMKRGPGCCRRAFC